MFLRVRPIQCLHRVYFVGSLLIALTACQAPPPPAGSAAGHLVQAVAQEAPTAPAVPAPRPATEASAAPRPEPAAAAAPSLAERSAALRNPKLANETAPERFAVLFETTAGELHLDVRRSWAPEGVDRLYNLVRAGYFDDTAFFRVIDDFVAQFGLHGDASVNEAWRSARIDDDPVTQSNVPGMVSFATSGKNSRSTQLFVNLGDNAALDRMGFAPLGRVRELEVAKRLYGGYGEGAPQGRGPIQTRIMREGNAYLRAEFPKLDYIKTATVEYVTKPSGE